MPSVKRHVRRTPQGRITGVQQYTRGAPVTLRFKGARGTEYSFQPQTEEDLNVVAPELERFVTGKAPPNPSTVRIADYLYRDKVLKPSLDAELTRLRTILEHEAPGQPGGMLITYSTSPERPDNDPRTLKIDGYSANPYKGSTWVLYLTPPYGIQNQREIATYVRQNEDEIVREIQKLIPRKNFKGVNFYETHPGLRSRRFTNPPPGSREAGTWEPSHEETG